MVVAHGDAGSWPHDGAMPPGDAHAALEDAHVIAADGGVHPHDAYVGHDAFVPPHDAAAPPHDAYVCPTYTHQVQPIYSRHCGGCHSSGSLPNFASSYTVANQSSSACSTSMAQCTIALGQPGGSMAYRDPLHGFSGSELATLRSWIACGRPH
jgi:hypothetical protein